MKVKLASGHCRHLNKPWKEMAHSPTMIAKHSFYFMFENFKLYKKETKKPAL